MNKATFFHAGCNICVTAEKKILEALDSDNFDIEVIHLGENKSKIPAAEQLGIKSVPALVLNNEVFHINYGASINDIKGDA